jgi:hypothetical protein
MSASLDFSKRVAMAVELVVTAAHRVLRCDAGGAPPPTEVEHQMIKRFATIAILSMTLPLAACSSGDDDAAPPDGDKTSPWAGKKYFLNMAGEWTVPRGIGRDIDAFVPSFLMDVKGTSADSLSVIIGAAQSDATVDTAVQNLCGPTQNVAFSGSAYPHSTIAPPEMRVYIKNTPMTGDPVQATGNVFGFTFTDVLPPAGSTTTTGKFKASMDFRELYRLFTALVTPTPDGVCESLYEQYTPTGCEEDPTCWVKCEPCPDDGAPYCLTLEAEDIAAIEAPNLNIVEVSEASRPATCVDPP